MPFWPAHEEVQFWLGAWGALLGTVLGAIKLYETFWKDRLRLETTYSFTGERGVSDEITIVNLTVVPVQVNYWALVWRPRFPHWRLEEVDVTPVENGGFRIEANANFSLRFDDPNKFDWGQTNALNRSLYLTLVIFGRKKPKVLRVVGGM